MPYVYIMFFDMVSNVESAMLEILKRIQTDVAEVKTRLGGVETRLGSVEAEMKKHRRDSAAMLVMMRGTVGVYDERLSAVEKDVRALQERLR
jgi:hypothetical protein